MGRELGQPDLKQVELGRLAEATSEAKQWVNHLMWAVTQGMASLRPDRQIRTSKTASQISTSSPSARFGQPWSSQSAAEPPRPSA